MKLFLRRDSSREDSRFLVSDDKGITKYYVNGRRSAATDRMVIFSADGTPVLTMRVAPFRLFYVFSIKDNRERFVITLTGVTGNPEYRFHGISWRVSEFSPDKCFSVVDMDNSLVMRQNTIKNYDNGYYELLVNNEQRELFCIATAVCADVVNYLTLREVATV